MIYSFTPNPALDLGGMVTRIIPNEKTYVSHETRNPGGNGINAARIAARLGVPVTVTGFLGGSIGAEIKSLLDHDHVHHCFVPICGHTRINLTVSMPGTHLQTRLSFPGPMIRRSEITACMRFITTMKRHSLLIVGGSLPRGLTTVELAEILRRARARNITCIVDVPSGPLKASLRAHPFLIKPNLLEFQTLIGKKINSIDSVRREAKALLKYVSAICVSSVKGGALLVSARKAWFAHGPQVSVRSSVGAGDSMVGAMVAALYTHAKEREIALSSNTLVSCVDQVGAEILRAGMAAALATLSTYGTQLGSRHSIRSFYKKVRVEEI